MDINHYKRQLNITTPISKYIILKKLTNKILSYTKAYKVEFYINKVLILKKINENAHNITGELLEYEYNSNDNVYTYKIYIYENKIDDDTITKITYMLNNIQLVCLDTIKKMSSIYYIFFKKVCIYSSNIESISHPMKQFEYIMLSNIHNCNGLTYRTISYAEGKFIFLSLIDITYSFELIKSKQTSYEQEIKIMNSNHDQVKKHIYNMFQYLEQLNDTELKTSQKPIINNTTSSTYAIFKLITDNCDYIKYELGTFDKLKYSTNIIKTFSDINEILSSISELKNVVITRNVGSNVPTYIIENPTLFKDLFINLCLFGIKGMNNGTINIDIRSEIINLATSSETIKHQLTFKITYHPINNPEELLVNITNGFCMIIAKKIIKHLNTEINIPVITQDKLQLTFKIQVYEDTYIREYSYLREYLSNKTYLITGSSNLKSFVENTLFNFKIRYTYDANDNFDYIISLDNHAIISDKKIVRLTDIYFNENKFVAGLLRKLDIKDIHILTCDDNAMTSAELKIKLNNLGYFNISITYSVKECLNMLKDKNIKILFLDEQVNNISYDKIIRKMNRSTIICKPKLIITSRTPLKNCVYQNILKPYDHNAILPIINSLTLN
jgi:hypothetical protein